MSHYAAHALHESALGLCKACAHPVCPTAQEDTSHVFVSIVPVVLDSFFKYWIFVGLNRQDPAATVTLKSMDRH